MTTAATSDAIILSHVTRKYGSLTAVDDLSLTIPTGRTVALLGPNGSGKSTTVLMLLNLLAPTAGRVRLYGRTPAEAVRAGMIGAMLQEGAFPTSARVRDVLSLASKLYPDPLPMDEVLTAADLHDLVGRRVDKLSGGQSQRVRFAFAYITNPKLLILDEPTVGMDVEARARFWDSIAKFAARDRTVLFTTHYLEEADAAADDIIVMGKGSVLAEGTAAQIKATIGTRTVSFNLHGGPAEGLERLAAVNSVEIRHDRAFLHTIDSDATIRDLLRSRGAADELELSGGSLDDAFLKLTHELSLKEEAH